MTPPVRRNTDRDPLQVWTRTFLLRRTGCRMDPVVNRTIRNPPFRRVVEADTSRRRDWLANPLTWLKLLLTDATEVVRYRSALSFLVRSNLKVRYQRSYLGFLWTLLHPLLMMVVLAAVFGTLMGRPLRSYTVFLFAGLLPWQFFTSTVTQGAASLVTNDRLIRKIYIPKLLLPLSSLANSGVNMLFAMGAFFLLLIVVARVVPQFIILPAAVVLLAMFSLGLGLLLMVFQTYFRDVGHMIDVVFRAWYFASPILYEPEMLARRNQLLGAVLAANPMTHFLTLFHCAFCSAGEGWPRWPSGTTWLAAAGYAIGTLLLGYLVYKLHEHQLIFRL